MSESNLDTLRAHCMSKDQAVEEYPWGEIVWKVKGKVFAISGETGVSVTVKSTLDKQAALVQHPDIEVARYVGRFGWVTIQLGNPETLALALDLIDESYESVGTKKKKRVKLS